MDVLSNHEDSTITKNPGKRTMRTIGVLSGWPIYGSSGLNPFSELLLEGIKDAASLHKCNLLISGGDNPVEAVDFWPPWNYPLPKAEYLPIGPWNTDGLIMTLPCSERMKRHVGQMTEAGHPVVTWGAGLGSPSVIADNEAGIRLALDHLYDHGHRKIAFMAGYRADRGDSLSRLQAYQQWMAERKLTVDSRQIVYGLHNEAGGQRALGELLSSGVEFTAVLASNDQSAVGAMKGIEMAGLRVPDDIAVIGFDNQAEAIAQIPPLTTISIPLRSAGCRLLELLLARIEGQTIPDTTRLPVELVVRQSCGCLPQVMGPPDEDKLGDESLIEAFSRSLSERNADEFLKRLAATLRRVTLLDRGPGPLQGAVSMLKQQMALPNSPADEQYRFAQELLHRASALISENERSRFHHKLLLEKKSAGALEALTTLLFSTLNETQVLQVLQDNLGSVGVRHAEVVFFETGESEDDPIAWGVIKRPGETSAELRFLSKHFPPPGLYSEEEPFHLALVPLISGDEEMGFIAFDAVHLGPCGAISRATAAAIRGARLYARVHELSVTDPLTGLYNRRFLVDVLQKEVERSQRNNSPFAVIMLDIDHFKSYNDTYGHPAGDEALRRVAGFIRQGARRSLDTIARYGGEEFMVILPEIDPQGAWVVAETIRTLVEECQDFHRPTTVSLGISLFQGNESTAKECIDRADSALYSAKESTRNCTRIFGRSGPLE